jgi:hypothetical protein
MHGERILAHKPDDGLGSRKTANGPRSHAEPQPSVIRIRTWNGVVEQFAFFHKLFRQHQAAYINRSYIFDNATWNYHWNRAHEPKNIMIDDAGESHLINFSLAKGRNVCQVRSLSKAFRKRHELVE